MHKVIAAAGLAILLLAVAACASADEKSCPAGFQSVIEYRMFFGLTDSDGNTVSEEEWAAFLADTITPRFPAGLTVLDARGQWLESPGKLQREPTKLVIGAIAAPEEDILPLVDEISEEFERRFKDPVFRMAQSSCAGLS